MDVDIYVGVGGEDKMRLGMDIQMVPGAIHSFVGRPIEEEHFAVIPASVSLLDVGQVEAGEAESPIVGVDSRHPTRVLGGGVLGVVVVPDVDRQLLVLAPPLHHVRGGLVVGEVHVAVEDDLVALDGSEVVGVGAIGGQGGR